MGRALVRQLFIAVAIALSVMHCVAEERIISLAPAMTEILFAIGAGDDVVGRTTECDFPPQALEVPAIGGFDGKSISVERILARCPTIVCGAAGMHDWLSPTLKPLGITLFLSRASTLHGVMDEIKVLGALVGREEGALRTVQMMERNIDAATAGANTSPPVTVYWEVCASPLMTAGASSFINDILTLAGAKNIFSDVEAAYPVVSAEAVLKRNCAVIVLAQDAYKDTASAVRALQKRPGWASLNALADGRIILADETALRPGPRAAEAVRKLREAIYGL